jgi:hypothetical protein
MALVRNVGLEIAAADVDVIASVLITAALGTALETLGALVLVR